MLDEGACVVSVMLAIVLAHGLGARMIAWAAFTAFVLMKGDLSLTLLRAALRMVGTVLGAGLALLVVPHVVGSLPLAMAAAGLVGMVGLYGTLTARRAYAWLLFGLTFDMILLDKLEHPARDVLAFAGTRIVEVMAGTIACLMTSLVASVVARRLWPAVPQPSAPATGWHPHAARHAAQAGAAIALLPLLHRVYAISEMAQAGVTIMAVMIVPVAGLGASGLAPVSRRLWQRTLGCMGGGLLAAAVLLLAQGNVAVLIAGTCLGIVLGRHIENGSGAHTYLGLQFTLAVLVALVPDSYGAVEIGPAVERLISIVIGMALLVPVLLVWHLFARGEAAANPGATAEMSE